MVTDQRQVKIVSQVVIEIWNYLDLQMSNHSAADS
jgi:hypothetical protein